MNKIRRMRLCDWALMVLTVLTLASSIQLEATGSSLPGWVWVHVVLAVVFAATIFCHLYLHFQWRNWMRMLMKQKSPVTRWMSVFFALTLLTAAIALIKWLVIPIHSVIGGVHGKIGFIFIALAIGHTIKRINSPILKNKK